uniref:ATP synthase complex subunit 8 n=1 Tax=Careproctus cypselurus TaxID=433400 RepID=A0A679DNS7_9TELE|nr:ATPase subunit 8 [Careproctus cypselurus]
MPQLDLTPWFMVLIFSWLVFLIVLPPKVIAHTFPNAPTLQNNKNLNKTPWVWPWQ